MTEEGALLRDRAEELVTIADKIESEFLSLDDITGGELYLGLAESYQIRHLAKKILPADAELESWGRFETTEKVVVLKHISKE